MGLYMCDIQSERDALMEEHCRECCEDELLAIEGGEYCKWHYTIYGYHIDHAKSGTLMEFDEP